MAMGNMQILVLALVLCTTTPAVSGQYYSKSVTYSPKRLKTTHLHFYFHDTLSGKNPSAVRVAEPNNITKGLSPFGTVFVIDDPLTVGPELTSEVIGNARGIYVSAGRDALSLVSYYDFGFTSGEFNGSSISVFSRNEVAETERELAVVGGRGKFRMAQGFANLKTTYFNLTTGDAIVEYHVTVFHH